MKFKILRSEVIWLQLTNKRSIKKAIQSKGTKSICKQKYHNVISKYGWWSKAGHSSNNSMKPNQDTYMAYVNLLWNESCKDLDSVPKKIHVFGVFDGHGIEGKAVSQFIKAHLPNTIK